MSATREVALREFRTRGRTKAFRAVTAILLLAALAIPLAITLWPSDDMEQANIGFTEPDANLERALQATAAETFEFEFTDMGGRSKAEIDSALKDGEVDVVVDGGTLVWLDRSDLELGGLLTVVLAQRQIATQGSELGLSSDQLTELLSSGSVEERLVNDDEGDDISTTIGIIGLLAAFILPQAFGQLTLVGVVEEKSTRVVEVLLSHIRPRELLYGKVIGLTSLAVIQLLIVVAGLTVSLIATDSVDIPGSAWASIPLLLVSVVGGLVIYNTFFALLGSLISRQEDASQVMLPVFLPLIGGYLVGQIALFDNSDFLLSKILTFVPFTAPMMLPVSVATDSVGPLGVFCSIASMTIGAVILLRIAANLYEFTLLHVGTRIGWSKVWKLMRGRAT